MCWHCLSFDLKHHGSGLCGVSYWTGVNDIGLRQVKNGILALSPTIQRYCGTTIPDPVQSSGNTMMVRFRTDGSISNRGFSATYSSDDDAGKTTEKKVEMVVVTVITGNWWRVGYCFCVVMISTSLNSNLILLYKVIQRARLKWVCFFFTCFIINMNL